MDVALAARNTEKLGELLKSIGASVFACDAIRQTEVERLFHQVVSDIGVPDIVIYNAGVFTRGPIVNVEPVETKNNLLTNAFGAFLVGQQSARYMLEQRWGAILFTGASAAVKGYTESAPFAMGKFALRGLCQSMARELAPKNIHVAHFILDGLICSKTRGAPFDDSQTTLDPDEIAKNYLQIARQSKQAWTWEVELRPFCENF